MENNIIISGLDMATITAADEARQHRDTLLALARKGTSIKDAAGAERATTILKDIKAFTRAIEDGRSAAKAPVLELGKKVDTLARDLTVELEAEATRISRLVGTFQQEQERIAAEARQRAFEEQERIRKEAEEKQRLADLEAKRVQDELAAKEARARSEAGKARAVEEAEKARLQAEKDRQTREMEANHAAAQAARVVPVVVKPAGIATRSEVKFEVTDIVALYEANAAFVLLSPNNAALKAALKQLPEGQTLPGVRHWREAAVTVR